MSTFDDLALAFKQAQEEVQTVGSRAAQRRLDDAARALRASEEATAQRAATDRQAAHVRAAA